MRLYLFRIIFLTILVWATACKPVDVDLLAEQIEAEVQRNKPTATTTVKPDPSEALMQVETGGTATLEPVDLPTLTVTIPVVEPGLSTIPITSTPGVTSTLGITTTSAVSLTQVVSTTRILTSTWDFLELEVAHGGTIFQVSWLDETRFAAASSQGLFLYQAEDLTPVGVFNLGDPVLSLAYSPDVGLLASGNYKGDIQWQDPDTGKYITTTGGHFMGVTDMAQPEGGLYLISGGDDGTVQTWLPAFVLNQEVLTAESMDLWQAPDRITSVDSHPYLPLVAAGSYQSVSLWTPGTEDLLHQIDGLNGWVNDLAISPDGGSLAVVDSSNHLRMWHTESWTLTHDIPIEPCTQIISLDFSPDRVWLALGCKNGSVMLWDVDENTLTDPLENYPYAVTDVAFNPFEPLLVSSYQDGVVRVWSIVP